MPFCLPGSLALGNLAFARHSRAYGAVLYWQQSFRPGAIKSLLLLYPSFTHRSRS